jgi:glycosyltransferase involved in cell wall biosynthesis
MKVLFIHNNYRSSAPSGEDIVAGNERRLLEENGVEVVSYLKNNDDIDESTFLKRLKLALNSVWSKRTYREISGLIQRTRPDVAHIHSIHPQISPSVYAACKRAGVPVVHTLHNYRYLCPGALLLRDGKPCEKCVGRLPLAALWHRCYNGSLAATGALVAMICFHRLRGTFSGEVDRYIVLTEFAKARLVAGGFPEGKIEIKPNFSAPVSPNAGPRERFAVYVGRLTAEKGVRTLMAAWMLVTDLPLKVIGDGALRPELEAFARERSLDVEFLGSQPRAKVLELIGRSYLQIIPSECYEGFPMAVLEAYACGTPVLASRIGGLAEVVRDGVTGLFFEAGNFAELARQVNLLGANPQRAALLGIGGRALFLERYTQEPNFQQLMEIYRRAGCATPRPQERPHPGPTCVKLRAPAQEAVFSPPYEIGGKPNGERQGGDLSG